MATQAVPGAPAGRLEGAVAPPEASEVEQESVVARVARQGVAAQRTTLAR